MSEQTRTAETGTEWIPDGDLLSVPGIEAGAAAAGIKENGALDVAVLRTAEPMTAVGMFTRNQAAAAPVRLCRARLRLRPEVRSMVINSGNANALTGRNGDEDCQAMADQTEELCGGPALVLSTGVIGVPLPMDRVTNGIIHAASALGPDKGDDLAHAILTTDTRPKTCALRFAQPLDGTMFRPVIGGVAKGSGMIHPRMATMLAVVATDAPLDPDQAGDCLARAVERSFHSITVDGDTSTNDTVILLARRPDDGQSISKADLEAVRDGITAVCRSLAEAIVRDGEGMTRLARIRVSGASNRAAAAVVGRSVATSSLVKTALAGGDPNWGRILSAASNTDVPVDPARMVLYLGGVKVFDGRPLDADEAILAEAFGAEEVSIDLRVGDGPGAAEILTTDLTKRYVEINSEYTT